LPDAAGLGDRAAARRRFKGSAFLGFVRGGQLHIHCSTFWGIFLLIQFS